VFLELALGTGKSGMGTGVKAKSGKGDAKAHESYYKEIMNLVSTLDFGTDDALESSKRFFEDAVSAMRQDVSLQRLIIQKKLF